MTAPQPSRASDATEAEVEAVYAMVVDLDGLALDNLHEDWARLSVVSAVLASDWLAARDAAIRAEAWEEGKWAGMEEIKRMLAYHSPTFIGARPEPFANPYRAAALRAAAGSRGEGGEVGDGE